MWLSRDGPRTGALNPTGKVSFPFEVLRWQILGLTMGIAGAITVSPQYGRVV